YKIALPIYYRNKIYSEEEREKLWLHKLDEEKRYVLNQEIDISKGDENSWLSLKTARQKNSELGYGSGEIDGNRKNYERQKRNLIQKKRIEEAKKIETESAIKWGNNAFGGGLGYVIRRLGRQWWQVPYLLRRCSLRSRCRIVLLYIAHCMTILRQN